ncbi:MAG: hypothetical protein KAI47_07980 [Deltaproteobacteria bacterium]|nr:hypothetical protein [Deltaproteobacteria bacterium]
MIRFEPVPQPNDFADKVEKTGAAWLADNPSAARPKDFWSPFKPALADGFRYLCAYLAMYEPVGTVDHFVSWNEDKAKAYEWANYRYCAAWINSSKQNLGTQEILDPFEVEDGWFKIILPSLQLVISHGVPGEHRKRAEFVLTRFHLRDDERIIRQRREWYRMYQDGELNLYGLRKKAPLIARAIEASEEEL